jgi:GNAT superfamily N-acetyltransferase
MSTCNESSVQDQSFQIKLRPARPDDDRFVFELYSTTREEEIATLGLDPTQRDMFLKLQFTAQQRHYDIAFPEGENRIILCGDCPIGRILVFRSKREIRLVDIALMPEHRGSGIGASLIGDLCDEARARDKPVTLHVTKTNRAAHLYERLGFKITGETGAHYKMEWRV